MVHRSMLDRILKTRSLVVVAVISAALSVTGCDIINDLASPSKEAPDEFTVYQRAPLAIPPDFGLRPPKPGAPRPQNLETRGQARAVVLGRSERPTNLPESLENTSPGIRQFLVDTGAVGLDPNIREIVSRETSDLAEENEGVADRILFWSKSGEYGKIIDADRETRRLNEREALESDLEDFSQPTIVREE